MDISEAFRILSLDPGSSEREIKERYYEQLRESHPDHGDEDVKEERLRKMAGLNEAYDVAIASIQSQGMIVSAKELIRTTSLIVAEEQNRREASREMIEQITVRRTSHFRTLRRITALLGAVSGTAAILGSKVVPMFDEILPISFTTTRWLAITAAIFGAGFLLLHVLAETAKRAARELGEALDDRAEFLDVIYEILNSAVNSPPWTRAELEDAIVRWIDGISEEGVSPNDGMPLIVLAFWTSRIENRSLAKMVGASDSTRLILLKGIQHGIFKENEVTENGRLVIHYDLTCPVQTNADSQNSESPSKSGKTEVNREASSAVIG